MNFKPNNLSRWPLWSSIIVGIFGLALSITLYVLLAAYARQSDQARFEAEAETLRQAVERECTLFFSVLGSICELHSLSEKVDASELEEFAKKGMIYQRDVLGPFGLTQGISHQFRGPYERMYGQNAEITAKNEVGALVRAANHSVYYPLTWQYPKDGLDIPLIFDLGSEKENRLAIEEMIRTGLPRMGGLAENGCFYGFSPIFFQASGRPGGGRLLGFAVADFDPERILERLQNTGLPLPYELSLQPSRSSQQEISGPSIWTKPLDIAGKTWMFSCHIGEDFLQNREGILPEIVLGSGLIISTLLTLLLLLQAGRTRRVERLVNERTADLEDSHRRLHEEMEERLRLEEELLDISSREKQRIGRDLHDSLGQKLTGAAFIAKAMLKKSLDGGNKEGLQTIAEQLKEAISQTRGIARGLAPMELDDGLCPALHSLSRQAQTVYGIQCTFSAEGEVTPELKTAEHLYRIAQEALNNAVRHGEATAIEIHLTNKMLSICDNGGGIKDDRNPDEGMGLRLMQYRAGIIGAKLSITARPEGGTQIRCSSEKSFPPLKNGA